MGPVFGDMLSAFPELLRNYEVFKMKPHTVAGYGERYNRRTVKGYWSWRRSGKGGIEVDTRVPNHQATFWVRDDLLTHNCPVKQFDYAEVDGDLYTVVEDDDFSREGGFSKCLMQRVAGNNGKQQPHPRVNLGIEDYR